MPLPANKSLSGLNAINANASPLEWLTYLQHDLDLLQAQPYTDSNLFQKMDAYNLLRHLAQEHLYQVIACNYKHAPAFQAMYTAILLGQQHFLEAVPTHTLADMVYVQLTRIQIQSITHFPNSYPELKEQSQAIQRIYNKFELFMGLTDSADSLNLQHYIQRHAVYSHYTLALSPALSDRHRKQERNQVIKSLRSLQQTHASLLQHFPLKQQFDHDINTRNTTSNVCFSFFKKKNTAVTPTSLQPNQDYLAKRLPSISLKTLNPFFLAHYKFNEIQRKIDRDKNTYTTTVFFDFDDTLFKSGTETPTILHTEAFKRFFQEAPTHIRFFLLSARLYTQQCAEDTIKCIDLFEQTMGKEIFQSILLTSALSKYYTLQHFFYTPLGVNSWIRSKKNIMLVDDRIDQLNPCHNEGFDTVLASTENSDYINVLREKLNMPADRMIAETTQAQRPQLA